MNIRCGPESLSSDKLLPVLQAAAMREADAYTIQEFGIDGRTLMEVAGRACAATAVRMLRESEGDRVAVVCGSGNNGGDGFVAARILALKGLIVDVLCITPPDRLSPDAAHQYRLLERLIDYSNPPQLAIKTAARLEDLHQHHPDLWIDALLGTGTTGEVRPQYRAAIEAISEARAPVLAIDIPSGLDADSGAPLGVVVDADVTVTMGALKSGMLFASGPDACGQIEVAEIGIPPSALSDRTDVFLTTDAAVRNWIPRRRRDAHKYSAGMVLVIGGSAGMSGAPVMSALAAARAGAGYVAVACQENIQPILAQKLTAQTTLALPMDEDGGIDVDAALSTLLPLLSKADAVALGPGLGRARGTINFVLTLLSLLDLPAVIDADALFALAEHPEAFESFRRADWILTPHHGEFKRLVADEADIDDPIRAAADFATQRECTLVLKGAPSVVAGPDGRVIVSGAGNNALATAGTGDVLTGLSAGFLARGLDPVRAAAAALHIGGAAADAFAGRYEASSMVATDLLRVLPRMMKSRFAAE